MATDNRAGLGWACIVNIVKFVQIIGMKCLNSDAVILGKNGTSQYSWVREWSEMEEKCREGRVREGQGCL